MAIKYNGKNVINRKTEEEKRREQEEKERRQKELQEKQLGLPSYMFKYAPPDLDWKPTGTAQKGQITSVKQKSSGLIYPAAQLALKAKYKRDQVEEQLKNAGKVTISGGNAFVPGDKSVKMPEVGSKDGNKAVGREVGDSDLGLRTSKEVLNSFLSFLEKENKSAQDVIDNPDMAENDPEKIKAQKDQTRLKEYQKNALTQLDALPKEATESQPTATPKTRQEGDAFTQKIQAGQNKQAQQGYQPIPKVLSKEAQYMWHITYVPQNTEGEDYVKWLQDGMDLGLYDRKDVNALIAQAGRSDDPLEQYMALDDSQKSGWLRSAGENVQQLLTMEAAKRYNQQHPYATDRDELLAKQEYYTGLRDEAQKRLDFLNGTIGIEFAPEGEMPYTVRDRTNHYYRDPRYREQIDEKFYDAIVGEGEYQKQLAEFMADPEYGPDAMELLMTEAWDAYEHGEYSNLYYILTGKNDYSEMESQLGYAKDQLNTIQGRLNLYDQYDAFMSGYTGAQRESYDPAKDRGYDSLVDYGTPNMPKTRPTYQDPNTKDVHRIYSFINLGKEYKAYIDNAAGGNEDATKVTAAYGKAALMLPEEIEIFNGYYNAGQYKEASEFLNGLSMALNDRYAKYEEIENREQARKYPVMSSLETLLAEQMSGALAIPRTFAGFAGEKSVYDPNSAWYASSRYTEQTQGEIANMIGGEGGKFYLAGMNTLRNLTNAAMVALAGVPASGRAAAGLAMFATQIYQDQTYKYLKETNDYGKAAGMATLDAVLETLEEMLPYEVMLSGGGNIILNFLANGTSEALEELTGATVGEAIKGLIAGRQDWEKRKDQIYNEGGYTDDSGNWITLDTSDSNKALAEAQTQAWKEKGHEIIENTVAGFVGGSLGASYGVWQNYNENKYWGKKVRGRQNIIGNETGADQLINAALGMKDDTASKKLALKISENANNGKEASDAQIGKLARTMATETNAEIADIVRGTVKWKIHMELTEAGASPEYAGEAAPILADAVMDDGKMNKSDVAAVAKDKRGIEVLKSWLVRGSEKTEEALEEKKVGKDTMNTMKANSTVKSLLQGENKYVYSGFVAREINDAHKSANMASEDVIATAKGRRAGRGTDAVWTTADQGDQIVQVIGKEGNKYRIKTEDGNTQLVDAGSLQAASDVLGTVMELGNRNNIKLEDEAVNAILRGYEDNKGLSGEKYVNDAINAYLRFRTGGTMEKSSLTDETLEQIRETAEAVNKREHESNLAEGKNQMMTAPGKGTIVYQNESGEHEFGSFAWKNALKSLDANRRTQANALAQLTTMIGTHVVLKYEPGTAAFGWEDSGTGRIVINLAATDSSGSSRHILTIAAHEMTHWLQQNSDEGYRELRQFVFDQLRKQGGEDAVEKLIMMTMGDYRAAARNSNNKNFELPSIERAMAEVVANACDQVLSNTKLIETLQNENPNLYEKVRGFVADFVKRIQDAIGNEELYNDSRESRLLKKAGQEVFDQLQEKWMIARNEAVNRERTPGTEKENGQQYSIAQNGIDKGMSDNERYIALKETKINISDATGKLGGDFIADFAKMDTAEKETALAELAREEGLIKGKTAAKKLTNSNLSIKAEFSKIAIHESMRNQKTGYTNLAALMPVFEETYYNAVPILVQGDRYLHTINKTSHIDSFAYLLGAYKYNGNIIPVQFEIKAMEDDNNRLYVVATIKDDTIVVESQVNNRQQGSAPVSSVISIEDIIKNVNPSDVNILSNIPSGFLTQDQLKGKRTGLKEKGDYFKNKAITKGTYNNGVGNVTVNRIDEAIAYYGSRGNTDYSKAYMAYISPENFLSLTTANEEGIENTSRVMVVDEMRDDQTPFLKYNQKTGEVTGHEGRHRIEAMKQSGVKQVAVLLIPDGEQGRYTRETIISKEFKGQRLSNGKKATGKATLENIIPVNEKHREELISTFSNSENWFQYSVPQRDVDVSAWKRYQMRDGELYMMDNNDNETKLTGLDREYVEAWWNHDWTRMEEILADKIRENGAIPFKTPNAYTSPSHQWVANAIKTGNTMAIGQAAQEMAQLVPDNAVLVPMPNHHGQTTDDTDTVVLAEAISKITGRPVIRALAGVERESRKADKEKPKSQQMKAVDLGFRQVEKIPEGTVPYFIDNVIASGLTAEAAHRAMGNNGVTLAYAKSTRSANDGLKRANVTFYDTSKQYGSYLIPLSERIDMSRKGYAGTKFSVQQMNQDYMAAVNDGDMQKAQELVVKAAENAGYTVHAYHGTGRADRVGTVFLPERATSGPMAYFTDSREIAEHYSKDKQDTSIAYDEEYEDYFKQFRTKDRNGRNIAIGDLWKQLSYSERQRITEAGRHISWDDEVENIIYNPEARNGNGGFTDWVLREKRGNAIEALIEAWLQGGDLYSREEMFLDVLKMAGIKNVTYNDPYARHEKVYDTLLKIQNPFQTSKMYNKEFLEGLESWWWDQDQDKYNVLTANADPWDKNSRTVLQWIEYAEYDLENGNSHAWTTIPDAVTDYLRSLGYDGIQDTGGKNGGDEHTVWIPFSSEQVKSSEPVTYDDNGEVIPLSERFNPDQKDIRYSVQQMEKTYESLNVSPDVYFRGTMEQINAAETAEAARAEEFRKLIDTNEFMALEFMKPDGRREILHRSSRPGVRYQLSYIGSDGEPTMHESYGRIEGENAGGETVHRMEELYDHFVRENLRSDLNISVMEDRNEEKDTRRYSIDQGDMNVQVWLQGLTESSLSTAQEKTMLRQYQDLKKGLDVMRGLNEERRRKLEKLLAKQNPSAYDRKQIRDLQAVMQAKQREIDRQEEKLAKVTGDKGFARLMYTQAKIMEDLVNGRTADDVRHTVDAISRELEAVKKEMAERSEQLKTLAAKEAVIRIRQQLNSAGLKRIAAKLKTDLNSNLSNTEIENRLALMALKMKEGKVDSDEVTELADMLIGKMNPAYDSYVLETLRGRTITLNKNQLAELKGQNRTVREIQQELAGTGIRIRTTGGNTLDQNWDELCDLLPQLNREASDADMLDNLLDLVVSERRAARAEGANNDQVAAMVVTAAADLIPEIVTDKKSMQLIRETLKYIAEMSRQAGETAKAMEELNSLMDRLQTKGRQAKSTLGTLENKIHDAIEYNNKLTEQSEAATWKEERRKLINSLNSEHAQAMIAQQQEFRERIEKDRKARNTQAENAALRRRINTNITRVRALLMRESAQKNIPEHMKPLARHMLEKIVNNDLVGRKISGISREDLQETKRVLDAWKAQDGEYNPDSLKGLDDAVQDALYNAVEDLISGIEYYNESAKGHSLQENLDRYNGALTEISNAVSTITGIINAERTISLGDRRVLLDDMAYKVQESTGGRRAKEFTGRAGLAIANLRKAVVSGNLTPEYFFRTLKNAGLDDLWEEYHRAENRNGLELMKAQTKLDEIAKKYGYKNWDMDKRLTVKLDSGDVSMTLGQIMSLYATWKREHTLGPAMSNHLQMGGFYTEESDPRQGFLGRRVVDLRAHRVNEQDMQLVQSLMTDEQQQFVDEIVSYMSNEMSELGNEASMKAYGIKMYKESYYFPFKMWDGIKARASNDSGSAAAANERAFHPSFSKTRQHNANNAVMIGDFMTTAADHIVGMINYATMGLANENLQRVLNKQVPEGDRLDTMTKRTIRTVLQEAYGKEATDYLAKLQEQLNGGVSRIDRTLYDRALTLFRKNAVAGSMSVALQQPLSYIRAAMMINPKYLAGALSPVYWRGSFKEMMAHSGVAVIKKMGRFDMGFGAGAREFITPEGKEGRVRQAWDAVTEKATILPELMDQMTWTRMWSAVKMEQHALHPEMDVHSDAFLDMVGERFNDVMRKTQVYDSTLTKSQNMRSQNPFVKSITSFMAEPTLTLNVLADAARNAGEKGGKVRLAKALATFALSAAAQAAVKAIMSSGRSPDDKKTWYENFAYRFWTNLIQEADVANLVPGYNDLIMLLKNGKLDDDAMGAIGKIFTAFEKMTQVASPDKINDYRAWEDGPAQIIQLFSQLPAKNIMRDLRAMYNWFIGKPYAQREDSAAVLKLQRDAAAMTADNLLGVIVAKLGEAGYKTTNKAYYGRMFDAMQRGDQEAADEIREYLQLAKNVKDEAIESGLRSQAKENLAPAESSQWMIDNDLMDSTGTITTQYKKGDITADEAKKLYKAADPKLSDDDIWWKIDQADYYKETGETKTGYYYRLGPALETNRSEQINAVIKDLLKHGRTKEQVKTQINTELKQKYLESDSAGRVRIRDEMQKAYKAAGYTVDDANKQIEKWKKDAEKKK